MGAFSISSTLLRKVLKATNEPMEACVSLVLQPLVLLKNTTQAITSIAVHPATPDYFATTSRDHTTRIYDLRLPAVLPVHPHTRNARGRKEYNPNPHWPPGKKPSLAGAAHGLRLHPNEIEGFGPGRCVAVLMGGRSGGHNAAVLHAVSRTTSRSFLNNELNGIQAFHPSFPLIATCGVRNSISFLRFG